jgi:hypothetical protein
VKFLRAVAWLLVSGLVVVTVVPAWERPVTGVAHGYEHFLSFGFVGFVFALAYPRRPIVLMLSAIAFMRCWNSFKFRRQPGMLDSTTFCTDALASCIGIGLSHLLERILRR